MLLHGKYTSTSEGQINGSYTDEPTVGRGLYRQSRGGGRGDDPKGTKSKM